MKKIGLLNSEISYAISKLGHGQHITICDSGLPIPENKNRIDVSIVKGIPSFLEVFDPIVDEMQIEEIIIAKEIKLNNPKFFEQINIVFKRKNIKVKITEVTHEEFKNITKESQAIIRTGECTPYANIILKSGVIF
ncbi:MAG: D-ribose pyranase [Fusobacteriaceae bacterium]